MPRIDITFRAQRDLAEIARYIALDNRTAATRWLERVDRALSIYAAHPLSGGRFEARPAYRFFTLRRYVFFCEPVEGGIRLARVLHGARDIESLLGERD